MKSLLFIEDPGLWLSVRAGELALRQRDGRYVHLDGRVRIIIAVAHGFCVTCAAIRYCSARHIELFVSDDVAAFVSLFAPEARGDARRAALKGRERQFRAAFDPRKTVEIAKAIVTKKVKAERHAQGIERVFLAQVAKAKTTDDVRHAEAASAQIWWRQWNGFEMRFTDPTVAAEWRSWPGRYIGAPTGQVRGTGGPIHGSGRTAPITGDAELFHSNRNGKTNTSDHRTGARPLFWLLTRRKEARALELGLGLRRAVETKTCKSSVWICGDT